MAERVELEFQGENRPGLIFAHLDVELAERCHALFLKSAMVQAAYKPVDITARAVFKECKEEVLLAFEVRVHRALAAAGARRNGVELRGLVSIPYKDFLGGIEQTGVGFARPKLLFCRELQCRCTHWITKVIFRLTEKLTGQYVS